MEALGGQNCDQYYNVFHLSVALKIRHLWHFYIILLHRVYPGLPWVYPGSTPGLPRVYQRSTKGLPRVYPGPTRGLPRAYLGSTPGLPQVYLRST